MADGVAAGLGGAHGSELGRPVGKRFWGNQTQPWSSSRRTTPDAIWRVHTHSVSTPAHVGAVCVLTGTLMCVHRNSEQRRQNYKFVR